MADKTIALALIVLDTGRSDSRIIECRSFGAAASTPRAWYSDMLQTYMMKKRFIRHDPHKFPRKTGRPLPVETAEVTLEIVRGRARNTLRPVRSPAYLIGAAPDCDLVLSAPRFADVYAYLLNGPQGVVIRHLGFVPELKINGQTASTAQLEDGDLLEIGPFSLKIHIRPYQREEWLLDEESDAENSGSTIPVPSLRQEKEVQAHVHQLLQDIRQTLQEDHSGESPRHLRLFGEGETSQLGLGTEN